MPRQPRYFIPGIAQHVVTRGVDRQATFFVADDYQLYRDSLLNAASIYDCAIHAYVLMTNHVHLLVTPSAKRSLPNLMQAMGRTYVQRLNRIYKRTGTLWEGRYKASPVQTVTYLLTCYRYIELNPVRAGITRSPAEYPYSSYACNAMGKSDPLVTPHARYLEFGSDQAKRLGAYKRLFNDKLTMNKIQHVRDTTNACLVLGNDSFKDQIETMIGRSVRPGKKGRPRK